MQLAAQKSLLFLSLCPRAGLQTGSYQEFRASSPLAEPWENAYPPNPILCHQMAHPCNQHARRPRTIPTRYHACRTSPTGWVSSALRAGFYCRCSHSTRHIAPVRIRRRQSSTHLGCLPGRRTPIGLPLANGNQPICRKVFQRNCRLRNAICFVQTWFGNG